MVNLTKEYETRTEYFEEFEASLKVGALMLVHGASVEQRSKAKVTLIVENKKIAELDAEVVYISPDRGKYNLGLELKGEWQKQLEEAKQNLPEEEEGDKKWGGDSESLMHRVAKMETHEKIQLAIKGGRAERRILLKDNHYMVHPYVLKNPKITTEEVSQIARMMNITSEMIKTIYENSEWMNNAAVRLAIVKNPKTPVPVVQKHLQHLKDNELIPIAKSDSVKEAISKMAKRIMAGRGKVIH